MRFGASGGGTNVSGAVSVSASALQVLATGPGATEPVKIAADRASLVLADLTTKGGGGQTSLAASGTLDVEKLSAQLPGEGQKPPTEASAALLHVDLKEISAGLGEAADWRVAFDAAVEAVAAAVGGGEVAKASIGKIALAGGRADQAMRIGADDLSLGDVSADISRALFAKPAGEGQPQAAPEAGTEAGPSPKITLGRFALEGPAKASFTDGTVSPPVRMAADIKTLEVSNLNMEDPAQRMEVRLSAVLNGFSAVDASGWAMPFAGKPSFDILSQVKDLELPPLSPYAAQAMGVNIDSGRLSLKADAEAEQSDLDGVVTIDLRNLAFGALSKQDEERLSAKVGVPIGTVVSLLQDAEGKISLQVPVSGNLASPDFDLSDAIGQAVTGAVMAGVTAPFKLIFEPVNMIAGGRSGSLALKPIPFAAGEASLSPEARVFIESLSKLLQQRPKLSLRVCGKSTQADVAALRARGTLPQPPATPAGRPQPGAPQTDEQTRAELTRLAEERTRAVREYLAERGQIQPARIGECRAEFEPQGKQGPRADATF